MKTVSALWFWLSYYYHITDSNFNEDVLLMETASCSHLTVHSSHNDGDISVGQVLHFIQSKEHHHDNCVYTSVCFQILKERMLSCYICSLFPQDYWKWCYTTIPSAGLVLFIYTLLPNIVYVKVLAHFFLGNYNQLSPWIATCKIKLMCLQLPIILYYMQKNSNSLY